MITITSVMAVVTTTPHCEPLSMARRHVGHATVTVPSSWTPCAGSEVVATMTVQSRTPTSAHGRRALSFSPTTMMASVVTEISTDHPLICPSS